MAQQKLFEVLADSFIRQQVSQCFALLGDANMNWAAAMSERECNFTYVRDEHCAVAAAMSWSRLTGQVGVATVTCGPGLTQILTALPAAVRANIPLVIFAGEAPLHSPWYNQQINQGPLVEACGAEYWPLHSTKLMPLKVDNAFECARRQLKPIVLGVPLDLQESMVDRPQEPIPLQQIDSTRDNLATEQQRLPDPAIVDDLADRVVSANKIVVMAGRGAVLADAGEACVALADSVGALLATTLPARGLFRAHPFNLGVAGGFSTETAIDCLRQADLVISVGCRLAHHNADGGKLFSAEKVISIDLQSRMTSQGRTAASLQLLSDAKIGVQALQKAVAYRQENTTVERNRQPTAWRSEALATTIAEAPADSTHFDVTDGKLDPRPIVEHLDRLLPINWTIVNSSGHCSYYFAQMPRRPVEHFLTIREFGAIGNGLAFAIGAAQARPEQPVVLFDGDGSFLMHAQELETIERHGLKILICVLNDGAYGSEIHKLRAEGLADTGAVFGHKDLAAIATGFGLQGVQISDSRQLSNLEQQLCEFTSFDSACVWDFHISDQIVSPVIRRSHK